MAERQVIPPALAGEVADILSRRYTHAELENRFQRAGVSSRTPVLGNKLQKATEFFRLANTNPNLDRLLFLGRLLQGIMDDPWEAGKEDKDRITKVLAEHGLSYFSGGRVVDGSLAAPTRSLEDKLRQRDLPALEREFDRALRDVAADPPGAVTAACAILESTFREYISAHGLPMPHEQSLQPLWQVVRKDLGLDPSSVEDADLRRVLGGLASAVDGIGAFRTHAGSAHGKSGGARQVKPREARLAVHAAHTVTVFVLETWEEQARSK